VCGRNLITGLTSAASPRLDISSTCKVKQKLGVSLPTLTCSPSAWPSWLLYHRGRKSLRDLRNYPVLCHSPNYFRQHILHPSLCMSQYSSSSVLLSKPYCIQLWFCLWDCIC
jgi:hypothetical protein